MNIEASPEFRKNLEMAPLAIKKAMHKQALLLLGSLRHPSLHAKKYNNNIWQARVNKNWRFYFIIHGDTYYLTALMPHPK
jgi:plasmid maintenance system killer protein